MHYCIMIITLLIELIDLFQNLKRTSHQIDYEDGIKGVLK